MTQQIVAIDLARLYGHEGHEVQKRSGNYAHFVVFIQFSNFCLTKKKTRLRRAIEGMPWSMDECENH
jgi:hypothetical protein